MSKIGRGNPFPIDVPTISLVASAVSVNEGQTLVVSLSRTASTYVSKCKVFTISGSAGESDYATQNGTEVTFNSGETSKTVNIAISNDALVEGDEDFLVQIANPNLAIIGNNKCIVTITGQGIPSTTITGVSNSSVDEGGSNVHNVTMSAGGGGMFTYAITHVTTSSGDFTLPPAFSNGVTLNTGIITVPNGVNSFTATISTVEDAAIEANETYTITIGGISGTGTILNDDAPAAATIASVSSPTITEGATMVFAVALTAPSIGQSFAFTVTGTAGAGSDYATPLSFTNGVTIAGGNLIVPLGVTNFNATTITSDDADIESSETVILTIGGVGGIGTITDNDTVGLSPLVDVVAIELPHGMLTTDQKTATATSGGYVAFAVSRDTIAAALYDLWYCATIGGTYTKVASDVTFTPSGLLAGTIGYDHRTVSIVDEKDFPASISSTTIGVIADTAGQQEFSVLNAYETFTIADDTSKVIDNAGAGAFDTPPIQVHQDETARLFVLTNYALDPTLRANGATGYYKAQPKTSGGTGLDLSLITPVSCTIISRASKPNPPRNIRLKVDEDNDYETYPTRQFATGDLYVKVDPASRAEVTPSSFFNPSGLNESGVTYHMDVYSVDGLARTKDFDGSYELNYTASEQGTDIDQEITELRFYAKKSGIKSVEVIIFIAKNVRHAFPEVSSVVLSQASAGANVVATINFDRTRAYPFGVDYIFSGNAYTDGTLGTLSVNSNAVLEPNERVQIKASFNQFIMTIPTTGAVGKTLTMAVGNSDSTQDDSIVIA